jgi:hypothetical protein
MQCRSNRQHHVRELKTFPCTCCLGEGREGVSAEASAVLNQSHNAVPSLLLLPLSLLLLLLLQVCQL